MRTYKDLAIAEEEQKLVDAVNKTNNLLVEAPTGSGKSLYIPWFLSNHFSGRIVVLQPRRIAALALAQYSAKSYCSPAVLRHLHLPSSLQNSTTSPAARPSVTSSAKTVANPALRESCSKRTVTFYRNFCMAR